MAKQYTVNLSERQAFYLWLFIFGRSGVVPKNREASRSLRGVIETFGVKAVKERMDALDDGKSLRAVDFSSEPTAHDSGSVDLNCLLGYLDDLSKADPGLSDLLLDVSDELLRAKEGRSLASVPAAASGEE